MSSKRFYVGNLFNEVSEQDLKKLFKNFGQVDKIEIKQKNDVDGNVMTKFAFVTVDNISDDNVVQCIKQNNNLKWKKQVIKVQVAQESFLSRLQREREDEASKKVPPPIGDSLNPRSSALENTLRTLASTELFSTTAENKKTVTFSEDEDEATAEEAEKISVPINKLERTKQKRVYHSSSSEAEDDEEDEKVSKYKRRKKDVLSKLESFDGGFWCDDNDKPLPIRINDKKKEEKEEEVMEENTVKEVTTTPTDNMFKNPTGGIGFSLLSTYGAKNEDHDDTTESTNQVSEAKLTDTFAWKLKEKAAIESAKGDLEPFFFTTNDKRFQEGQGFLQRIDSLNELRTKYDEKRPILASIIKKKVKSRNKKQEKLSFAVNDKKKRRFNVKRKSGKQFKH